MFRSFCELICPHSVCQGLARLKDGLFWVRPRGYRFPSIRLHKSNDRRTAEELDYLSPRNIFHINWFVLEYDWDDEDENLDQLYKNMTQKPIWRHGTLYGSEVKKLGITSFTV